MPEPAPVRLPKKGGLLHVSTINLFERALN